MKNAAELEGLTAVQRFAPYCPVEGQPTRVVKAGDAFQIPPETPHAGGKPPETKCRLLITYIVDKSKPLATPV